MSADTITSTGTEIDTDKLVLDHLVLARTIAWKHFRRVGSSNSSLDQDSMVSLAFEGLVVAAKRWPAYCAERGYDPGATEFFVAFAMRRINGTILDSARAADWISRASRQRAKALKAAEDAGARGDAEVAAAAGLTLDQVHQARADLDCRPMYFDPAIHDGSVPEDDTEAQAGLSALLSGAVATMRGLPLLQQAVLVLRFWEGCELAGIAGRLGQPLEEVKAAHDSRVLAVHHSMLAVVAAPE